jgi:hypothetical protein
MAVPVELIGDGVPAAFDLAPCLDQRAFALFWTNTTLQEFASAWARR